MVEIPPDPRKSRKAPAAPNASKPGEKQEPDHIRGVTKKVSDHIADPGKKVADHVASSGKGIDDRRGAPEGTFGQPPHVPTNEQRERVKMLASFGNRHVEIALLLDISEDTLTRHYDRELKTGALEANTKVAQSMFRRATAETDDNLAQRAGEYWLSRRAGWKETSTHEHTGAGGGPIETRQLPATDDWLKQFAGAGTETSPPQSGED
jgi:hypothetical protein